MPYKTADELEAIRKEVEAVVWPMLSQHDTKTWTFKCGTDKATTGLVYKGSHPTIGTLWKTELIIDISAEEYIEHFAVNAELLDWIANLKRYEFLERGDGWSVAYSITHGVIGVSGRDFVSLNMHRKLDDGGYFLISIATDHPNAPTPKESGYVRGEYFPSGTILRPVKGHPNRCEMFYTNNCDIKGYLPRSLVNMALSTFMLDFSTSCIEKCKQIAAKRQ